MAAKEAARTDAPSGVDPVSEPRWWMRFAIAVRRRVDVHSGVARALRVRFTAEL